MRHASDRKEYRVWTGRRGKTLSQNLNSSQGYSCKPALGSVFRSTASKFKTRWATLRSISNTMQGLLASPGPSPLLENRRRSGTLACSTRSTLPPPLWAPHRRCHARVHASSDGELSADWEQEMSIFKKRTLAPNQLETLRTIEATVDVGKVNPFPLISNEWILSLGTFPTFPISDRFCLLGTDWPSWRA